MKFISLKGGGKVHIVRAERATRAGIGTAVVMECGKTSGQFASVFDRPSIGHLNICHWCVQTYNSDQRSRAAAMAPQVGR